MKSQLTFFLLLPVVALLAQQPAGQTSPFDAIHWGVVLEHPAMKDVEARLDVPYLQSDHGDLHMDVYLPPGLPANERRPAIIFLNGIGETEGRAKVKSWGIYATWPRLVAAHGYVGISMETDGARIRESFDGLFNHLAKQGARYHVDADRLGVYAASANIRASAAYLMDSTAYAGIKAGVLYYGQVPPGPYRTDLPILFVVAETDINGGNYDALWTEVLRTRSPWTIKLASDLPHAFDAFSETEAARRVVMETLSFWKNHLDPVPTPTTPPSKPRAIIAAQYAHDDNLIIQLTREWLKENPDTRDASAYHTLGHALLQTKEFAEAERYLQKSLALNPEHSGTLLSLVITSHALNRPEEAQKLLARYEKEANPDQFTYYYLANNVYNLQQYATAAAYYEKTLAYNPPTTVRYNLGCCYALAGEKDKAFTHLFSAAELGFDRKATYEADADLESLKSDKRWGELMGRLK